MLTLSLNLAREIVRKDCVVKKNSSNSNKQSACTVDNETGGTTGRRFCSKVHWKHHRRRARRSYYEM